jgi:hypothetical protein
VYSIEQFYDQLADKGMMPKAGEHKKDDGFIIGFINVL